MGDPTGITAISSGLTTIIKICEITYALKAVKEQTTALLQTTNLVSRNIHEAKRLLHQKSALVRPEDKRWMERTIGDAQIALNGISVLVEAARVNLQNSRSVDLMTKVVWVFRDNLKAGEKMAHLGICHQALCAVITCLHNKDVLIVTPVDMPVVDDARDRDEDDGLPSYAKSQMLNQILHRRRSSRKMKQGVDEMPPRPPKVPLKDDRIDINLSVGPPLVTVRSADSNYLSPFTPSSSYAAELPGDMPFIGTELPGAVPFMGTELPGAVPFMGTELPGAVPFMGTELPGAMPFIGTELPGAVPFMGTELPRGAPLPFIGTEPTSNRDFTEQKSATTLPTSPRRRRQWLTMQAAQSNLFHLDP